MSAQGPTEGARRGLAGRVLGDRYRVERMVSAGATTLIADAEDTEVGRAVTVKLVRPEIAESPEFRRKFEATMRAMSKLSHPNIAAVHDWGEEEVGRRTTVYAVVERLAGGSLRDVFDRGRRLDPSQALMVGLEACRALDFAHRKRLVHGELIPSKLVFGDDRRLRIVDFGLARLLSADDWKEPSTVPTHVARYSSPEQALGQPIDGKSDVYSLALILVEAVSGAVPFAARSTVATLSARVGRLMPVSADLGPLAAVLERAGRPDPADRSTASEFGRGLVRAAEKLPRPTPIPIVVSSLFEEDPSQLRRPNDPTGGVDRPPPEPVVPLVAPADGPEVAAAPAESTIAAAPEERAAAASIGDAAATAAGAATAAAVADLVSGAAGAGHDATGLLPAAASAPTAPPDHAPPPGPDADAARAAGEDDLVRGELAALAQPPTETTVSPTAAPVAGPVAATAPPAGPPLAPPPPAVAPPPPPSDATDVVPTTGAAGPGWSGPLESLDAGRKRRRWVPWVIALVVVAALAGLGLLALRLFEVPTHPVPDLVGSDEATARAATADFDWDIEVRHDRSDEFRTPGEIIRTAPAAGQELAEDEPFLIVVSDGPEFRALADLVGLTRAEAETKLAQQELVALPAQEQPDESVPAGSVVSWSVP
ncbi:MAG TPA: protein kinase, partial [Ilumatobacteraceae bacterium]|nr:protein kinase [Ilumatobacteraceae bacterium]